MVKLDSPELKLLARALEGYNLSSTVPQISGLLTMPFLQANTIRIEILAHLAVTYCRGDQKPGPFEIEYWLNNHLGKSKIVVLEDPVEDVFITNVETEEGNRRIFEGNWESNDYFLQVALETICSRNAPNECRELLVPVFALLRLSECVAERISSNRWCIEPSIPNKDINLPASTIVDDRARAVTFTERDLDVLGLRRDLLAPFILPDTDKKILTEESTGHSSLERHPLVGLGNELVLVLPHAVSPAIRRFFIFELGQLGYLQGFEKTLANIQADQVMKEGLFELRGEIDVINPGVKKGSVPFVHDWLFKYDINKYLHVILLHDRMDWLNIQGLSSFMRYPEDLRQGLENYLNQVTDYCQSLPDFIEGMSLMILGGLGRGFALSFRNWPDKWHFSVMRISDLLTLAGELNRSIIRYLKCIKQKEWAERKGVFFHNVNGDYNFYCFWRSLNSQLVPRELPVDQGTMLSIAIDWILPVRAEVRNLMDRHVIGTTEGFYTPVMRLGRDAYFDALKKQPVYTSLAHLGIGVLAGAVETPRGPSWFLAEPRQGDEQIQRFIYEIWSGFIDLYARLVFEVECIFTSTPPGAIEIRLNFSDVIFSEDLFELQASIAIEGPEVAVTLDQRIAVIKFPSDLLMLFQQPEDAGERFVMRAIAKGLVGIHQGSLEDVSESVLDTLINKIVAGTGMRILHLFRTYDPLDLLLVQQGKNPIFLAHEDFVFSKLRLSEDCTTNQSGTYISSKAECNQFLHRIVDKIWNQLRILLKQFDRASVIRKALEVNESILQDRDHWRRTAQALLALYAPEENVFAVAQSRESDRTNVSLSARTILEMAICECPKEGGRRLSRWELDELFAKVALLVEVATDSDAVNSDLLEPQIELHPNGEYTIDRKFHDTVIKPFLTDYSREEFEMAAKDYSKLYRKEPIVGQIRADQLFSDKFIHAFQAEFGLAIDEAIDGAAKLLDFAVECDKVVVETTVGNLKKRLTAIRGLSTIASETFIRTFGIFHRQAWDNPPPSFSMRDIIPWRHSRRLSAIVKPILLFGNHDDDKAFYGAGTLQNGIAYLLGRAERGRVPQEFFTSTEMRKYIGAVNSERGHSFARSVSDSLSNDQWMTRNEIQMAELGASAKLGDLDVLAWKLSGEIQLIECKRLHLARTVAEIAEICRRFRGEAKDELGKHVRRVNWIKANPGKLERIVGFVPNPDRIEARLVTNTHVPMRYLKGLPIEADKIGPI